MGISSLSCELVGDFPEPCECILSTQVSMQGQERQEVPDHRHRRGRRVLHRHRHHHDLDIFHVDRVVCDDYSVGEVAVLLAVLEHLVAGRAGCHDHRHAVDRACDGLEVLVESVQAPGEGGGGGGDGGDCAGIVVGRFLLGLAGVSSHAVSLFSADYVHGVAVQSCRVGGHGDCAGIFWRVW